MNDRGGAEQAVAELSAQYPGDFSGGVVDIRTQTTPDEDYFNIKFRSYPEPAIKSFWQDNKQIIFQHNTRGIVMSPSDENDKEQLIVIRVQSCRENVIYGMIASNGIFTDNFYFDLRGMLMIV